MSKDRPTINDIARLAGVSKTTVSFALNSPERVAAATLERIRRIADELNYSPDPIARTLATKKTGTIGFLLPETTPEGFKNPLLFQFLQGMRMGCLPENLSLNVISPPPGMLLDSVRRTAVDGYVILGMIHEQGFFEYLKERNIPAVSLDGGVVSRIPAVTSNEEYGACAAMEHVLENGHRKILILAFMDADDHSENFSSSVGYRRLRGYEKALEKYGLSLKSENITVMNCGECSLEGGYNAIGEIAESGHLPDAVLVMSDIIAIGVYQYCREKKIQIPEDISIVGYDNLYEDTLLHPPMTTVAQPAVLKGEKAVQLLIEIIKGRKNCRSLEFEVELIKRGSVKEKIS